MERLRHRDFRALLAFLREAYGQPDLDGYARAVVGSLTGVVGAHRVSYNEAHSQRGTLRVLINPVDDIPPLTARQYRDHPMMQHFIRTGDGRAHKFSDFLTREELRRTEMYEAHYRPAGVEHQMTVCLGSPVPHVVAFALGRDHSDFTERERLACNLLRPHLATAYDRASATARLQSGMALLARAAEAAAVGIVLLSKGGGIAFMTARARHWLRVYFPRRGRPSSRLPTRIQEWLSGQVAWGSSGGNLPPPPLPLVVARDGRRLTIRAAGSGDPTLLLEESIDGLGRDELAPLGLTPRESEVLVLVARGSSNEAIAEGLGTKPRTVAKHVERIHRKLGVDSRAAAAARAHEVSATPRRLIE